MLACMRDNPMRVPNWPWLRATGALEGTQVQPARRRDTPRYARWIQRAMAFIRALQQCRTELARQMLAYHTPDIFWAHQIWTEQRQEQTRYQIEAYILAKCGDYEIGHHAGVPPQVVEAYEALFFNVREKLIHKGYILHTVIGPAVARGLSEREYDVLWKLYGYQYGPLLLDALIGRASNPLWCGTADAISSTVNDDTIGSLKLKAMVAAKTIPVNAYTQVDILNIFAQFVEIERTTDSAGKAQDVVMGHIDAMLNGLPFSVAGRDPRRNHLKIKRGALQVYEETSIELSYEETLRVSAGETLPYAAQLQSLRFPEP